MTEKLLVPFFLENVHSSTIGFGGGLIILSIFGLLHYKNFQLYKLFYLVLLYGISIGIGVGLAELGALNDRSSAAVAGVWAPIFSCICSQLYLYIYKRSSINKLNDLDHFID
jgi:hypothetical protein